jgi:hypothetical protein
VRRQSFVGRVAARRRESIDQGRKIDSLLDEQSGMSAQSVELQRKTSMVMTMPSSKNLTK